MTARTTRTIRAHRFDPERHYAADTTSGMVLAHWTPPARTFSPTPGSPLWWENRITRATDADAHSRHGMPYAEKRARTQHTLVQVGLPAAALAALSLALLGVPGALLGGLWLLIAFGASTVAPWIIDAGRVTGHLGPQVRVVELRGLPCAVGTALHRSYWHSGDPSVAAARAALLDAVAALGSVSPTLPVWDVLRQQVTRATERLTVVTAGPEIRQDSGLASVVRVAA